MKHSHDLSVPKAITSTRGRFKAEITSNTTPFAWLSYLNERGCPFFLVRVENIFREITRTKFILTARRSLAKCRSHHCYKRSDLQRVENTPKIFEKLKRWLKWLIGEHDQPNCANQGMGGDDTFYEMEQRGSVDSVRGAHRHTNQWGQGLANRSLPRRVIRELQVV